MSNTNKPATLIKQDGERITKEPEIVVNPVESVGESEIDNICQSLLLTANFAGDKPTGATGETVASFTRAIISRLSAPIDDHELLLEALKKRRKATLEYAQELAGDVEREWVKQVSALGKVFNADGTPIWMTGGGDGWKFEITVDEAVSTSARKMLYEFCKSSYYAINGAPAKRNSNGKLQKPKDPFDKNPDKRGTTKDGYGHSPQDDKGECDWSVDAALQVMLNTSSKAGNRFVKAVHLVSDVVKCINESDKEGARKAYNALRGFDDTGRFRFTKELLDQLIRIRFLGSLVSDLQGEIAQLKALPADVDKLREWKKVKATEVSQYLTYIDQALISSLPEPVTA